MRQFLVGYSIIHKQGNAVSRMFMNLSPDRSEIVTSDVIIRWESEIRKSYGTEFQKVTIRVFTFQEL